MIEEIAIEQCRDTALRMAESFDASDQRRRAYHSAAMIMGLYAHDWKRCERSLNQLSLHMGCYAEMQMWIMYVRNSVKAVNN